MSRTKSRKKADAGELLNDLAGMVDGDKPEEEKQGESPGNSLTETGVPADEPGVGEPNVTVGVDAPLTEAQASEESPTDQAQQDGKPGLPEPEAEPEYLNYSEDDADEEEDQDEREEITFTEKDRNDFPLLEQRAENGGRQQAEALREIRQRQLWLLIQDNKGKQLYPSFEEYCQERLGHPRQWVTHQTNWLRLEEERERLGIKDRLTVKAAQGLLIGRLEEAGGLRAVLEEAKEDGVPLDRDHLRAIVIRRAEFNYYSRDGKPGINQPAAMTYAEYKMDLATVKQLGEGATDYRIVSKAKELDGDFADNVVTVCKQERVLPRTDNLLAVLTGKALAEVVARLKETAKESVEIEEKQKTLAARKKEIRAMQQEGGLKKLKDEAKALQKELEAKGVLKKKKKGAAQPEPALPGEGPSAPASSDDDGEQAEDADVSEVRDNVATALGYLDDALTCEWPDAENASELNAILVVVNDCGTKLAGITAKVKELVGKVFHADALDLLRTMPVESVDAVIADAMYGTSKNCRYEWGVDPAKGDPLKHWQYHEPIYRECLRVLRPGGVLAWGQGAKFCQHFGRWFAGHRIWTLTRFRLKGMAATGHVWVVQSKEQQPVEFPHQDSLVMFDSLGPLRKVHPCIKPPEEPAFLIESLTQPGQVVLDCFCGLGSTLLACQQLGRSWIGCDLSRAYCRVALRRLKRDTGPRQPE